jgi:2-oxoglutarate dehydrogenase E2 component (dihydrolipoamide succinyltransferase)
MADITLPQLGETVTEGTITRWFKKVGDTIAADEPLFEVSTDKVDTEVPSPVAGTVTEIRVAEGETVAVGTVIAVVGAAGAAPAPAPVAAAPAPVAAPAPAPVVAPAPAPAPVVAAPSQTNKLLSPVVRRLVTEHQIDIDALTGSGPGGRITREDVLDYIDQHGLKAAAQVASAPAPAPVVSTPAPVAAPAPTAASAPRPTAPTGEREQVVALSKIRKLTGAHMVMSKAVSPHAFSVVEVDYANVDRTRTAVKESWKSGEGFSLTYLPFIARAVVDALADFPHVNSSIDGDNLVVHGYIDLGIAVDLDYQGLLVPVVRSADAKRLRAIAREINDLATRARGRKLSPDEIQGGTFTLSNNGSAGALICMPIINQPQVAILSTDAIVRKPVVVTAQDGSESIAIHPMGHLSMSWDHRAFDGAYAARFISRVKQIIETQDWSAEL